MIRRTSTEKNPTCLSVTTTRHHSDGVTLEDRSQVDALSSFPLIVLIMMFSFE